MNNLTTKLNNNITIDYKKPRIMGIINCTPDSFYDGNKYHSLADIINTIKTMTDNQVDIIDIGGESSRPGSEMISQELELSRVIPVIKSIKENFPELIISIDTYKAEVARQAIECGAHIINDISGCTADSNMINIVKDYNVPIIIMHMLGIPKTMQNSPEYEDIITDLLDFFEKRINFLTEKQIDLNKIIIDPGIGFGKTKQHNIQILKNINKFTRFQVPVLIGASNKRIIGDITNKPINERTYGSLGIHLAAICNGANIIRVHNVAAMNDVINTFFTVKENAVCLN